MINLDVEFALDVKTHQLYVIRIDDYGRMQVHSAVKYFLNTENSLITKYHTKYFVFLSEKTALNHLLEG
jgi:hypothetical protein